MSARVLVFEDNIDDQRKFRTLFNRAKWPLRIINHHNPPNAIRNITEFRPELAIVDSWFDWQRDGLQLVKEFQELCPEVPVVVCTVLRDKEQYSKHQALFQEYHDCGVNKILPKRPFPTIDDFSFVLGER
jgi:DNA-binding NtrC family response regulator